MQIFRSEAPGAENIWTFLYYEASLGKENMGMSTLDSEIRSLRSYKYVAIPCVSSTSLIADKNLKGRMKLPN